MKILDKIDLPIEPLKVIKKRRISVTKPKRTTNNYTYSTEMIRAIVERWEDNQVIMNLANRIREVEKENGILKSDIAELKYINTEAIQNEQISTLKKQLEKKKLRITELQNRVKKLVKLNEK